MVSAILLLVAALGVAILVWWCCGGDQWLPTDLRNGKLIGAEVGLLADVGVTVSGRLDRVYLLASGEYIPLEYKNRDTTRLYKSDMAQLSLQSWLLRRNGKQTAKHAYLVVRERGSGKKKAVKVEIGDDAFCEKIIKRYLDLRMGLVQPIRIRDQRCKSCGHHDIC